LGITDIDDDIEDGNLKVYTV